MQTTYRNYTINVGTTERRDGSVVTEACISVNYQPLHSIYTIAANMEAFALELAQRWIDAHRLENTLNAMAKGWYK